MFLSSLINLKNKFEMLIRKFPDIQIEENIGPNSDIGFISSNICCNKYRIEVSERIGKIILVTYYFDEETSTIIYHSDFFHYIFLGKGTIASIILTTDLNQVRIDLKDRGFTEELVEQVTADIKSRINPNVPVLENILVKEGYDKCEIDPASVINLKDDSVNFSVLQKIKEVTGAEDLRISSKNFSDLEIKFRYKNNDPEGT